MFDKVCGTHLLRPSVQEAQLLLYCVCIGEAQQGRGVAYPQELPASMWATLFRLNKMQ